jgi:hypothetical protein
MTDTGTALAAILITVWPSAGQVAEPATTLLTCRAAADAALVWSRQSALHTGG